jgi:hypothetical protein
VRSASRPNKVRREKRVSETLVKKVEESKTTAGVPRTKKAIPAAVELQVSLGVRLCSAWFSVWFLSFVPIFFFLPFHPLPFVPQLISFCRGASARVALKPKINNQKILGLFSAFSGLVAISGISLSPPSPPGDCQFPAAKRFPFVPFSSFLKIFAAVGPQTQIFLTCRFRFPFY